MLPVRGICAYLETVIWKKWISEQQMKVWAHKTQSLNTHLFSSSMNAENCNLIMELKCLNTVWMFLEGRQRDKQREWNEYFRRCEDAGVSLFPKRANKHAVTNRGSFFHLSWQGAFAVLVQSECIWLSCHTKHVCVWERERETDKAFGRMKGIEVFFMQFCLQVCTYDIWASDSGIEWFLMQSETQYEYENWNFLSAHQSLTWSSCAPDETA